MLLFSRETFSNRGHLALTLTLIGPYRLQRLAQVFEGFDRTKEGSIGKEYLLELEVGIPKERTILLPLTLTLMRGRSPEFQRREQPSFPWTYSGHEERSGRSTRWCKKR